MSSPLSAIPTIVETPPLSPRFTPSPTACSRRPPPPLSFIIMSSDDDDVLPLPLPPPPTRQTDAVKEIMAKVVSRKSTVLYAQQNSIFALFCYASADHLRDLLLEPWFIEGLNALKSATQKKKYAKNCCLDMSPDDDNCPFILSNLTFVAMWSMGHVKERYLQY